MYAMHDSHMPEPVWLDQHMAVHAESGAFALNVGKVMPPHLDVHYA
jgi:hypothetical protein